MIDRATRTISGLGMQSVSLLALIVASSSGLLLLESQIEVYSFGDSSEIDARFLPKIVLWLLLVTTCIRVALNLNLPQAPLGSLPSWFRVAAVACAMSLSIYLLPKTGFFIGSLGMGVATAFFLGERRLFYCTLIPFCVSVLITVGAKQVLNIPLP